MKQKNTKPSVLAKLVLFLLECYRLFLSPFFGNQCRYLPTCSNYAKDAVMEYGALQGSFMTLKRLLRCHPFSSGGYDPVPCCQHGTHHSSELQPSTHNHGHQQ